MDSIALDSQIGSNGSSWLTSIRKDSPSTIRDEEVGLVFVVAVTKQRRRGAPSNDVGIEIRDPAGTQSPSPAAIGTWRESVTLCGTASSQRSFETLLMASLGYETQNWATPDKAGVHQHIRSEVRAKVFMAGTNNEHPKRHHGP